MSKITLTIPAMTVTVDPDAWGETFGTGTDPAAVAKDARDYFLNLVQQAPPQDECDLTATYATPGPRQVYYAGEATFTPNGTYEVWRITEGEPGYTPVNYDGHRLTPHRPWHTQASAESTAATLNALAGHTPEDVHEVRLSSMRAHMAGQRATTPDDDTLREGVRKALRAARDTSDDRGAFPALDELDDALVRLVGTVDGE